MIAERTYGIPERTVKVELVANNAKHFNPAHDDGNDDRHSG